MNKKKKKKKINDLDRLDNVIDSIFNDETEEDVRQTTDYKSKRPGPA